MLAGSDTVGVGKEKADWQEGRVAELLLLPGGDVITTIMGISTYTIQGSASKANKAVLTVERMRIKQGVSILQPPLTMTVT